MSFTSHKHSWTLHPQNFSHVEVARHVCQEARVILTSLRGGPPHVARGDLSQALVDIRKRIEREMDKPASTSATGSKKQVEGLGEVVADIPIENPSMTTDIQAVDSSAVDEMGQQQQMSEIPLNTNKSNQRQQPAGSRPATNYRRTRQLNPYALPFLQVITDPRASGPHTLVTIRAVYRLLDRGSFRYFGVSSEEVTQSILACKFEQTDAGSDEAVEMAIADVLCLLVHQDYGSQNQGSGKNTWSNWSKLSPYTLMDAFNTVFVTRKTFIHNPAMCYHFEDVLTTMIETVFRKHLESELHKEAAFLLLTFLVNQLLHTPLVGGDGLDDLTREAQMNHDDTRTLCLKLTRCALRVGWSENQVPLSKNNDIQNESSPQESTPYHQEAPRRGDHEEDNRTLIQIIQDDLCLSLLMTGQAIWAYHDTTTNVSPGFVSLEVLSEICATLSVLWTTSSLRSQLIPQFETILTGFYTRALVLLRKRKQPTNSVSFNANLIFDAEVEIIMESLVDLLCLHDHSKTIVDGEGGSLETMFACYDCNLRRSSVASGIMVELSRCCGGLVNEEGDAILSLSRSMSQNMDSDSDSFVGDNETKSQHSSGDLASMVRVEHPYRQVPAHLRELCAQAIMGGMKCLFRDDNPTAETLLARSKRKKSIMLRRADVGLSMDDVDSQEEENGQGHYLRDLKSKKRLMRKGAQIFNQHASRGIEFLVDSGLITEPVSPAAVAAFLRNGIVVGLDKKQIGIYLGEAGKSPVAGKSPPSWERDWFHKDVLKIYCSLFRFENQSLLDGLRMFLATFRLPGEAQQIDRILQSFADSCGQVCEESSNGKLKLFSDDPKRASDAAYLLSFSIIMLNTDRHNANIREDRKMSCEAFIKNNTDYGRDITEKGKELPPQYLASIYDSINEEPIRTEGEGAEGAMTVERWKDVLRGSTEVLAENERPISIRDAEDLTELILEHVWKPIMSAIGALWGATTIRAKPSTPGSRSFGDVSQTGMLGVQGARLGMDLALAMLSGVRKLGRIDIFRKIFTWVCEYTGLLNDYTTDCIERGLRLTNSLESQSAIVVVIRTALEAAEDLDEECWKRVWSIVFELRDLKLISLGSKGLKQSLLVESDADLLKAPARIDWNICLAKGDMNYDARAEQEQKGKKTMSVFGAFGRALFGSTTESNYNGRERNDDVESEKSIHGKENLVIWNEAAPSDDEGDTDDDISSEVVLGINTVGDLFENRLIRESLALSEHVDMPVTGLERVEETRRFHISPRAQARERLRSCMNLCAFVTDSRYMDEMSFLSLLKSLASMVSFSVKQDSHEVSICLPSGAKFDRSLSVDSTTSFTAPQWNIPVSPASEALAEVLLCELALKNKDRLKITWDSVLQEHYLSRLTSILVNPGEVHLGKKMPVDPGLEKRVTGLLRLSAYAIQRSELANDILSSWKYLLPMNDEQHATSPLRALDRHIGEGLWRIVSHIDSISNLNDDGWEGLISLISWCAKRGGALKPIPRSGAGGLADDDPALHCYRTLHLLLNNRELDNRIPCSIVSSLRSLVVAGGRRRYPQLSTACLDLLSILHEKKVTAEQSSTESDIVLKTSFWTTCWRKIIEGISEAAELSTDAVSAHKFVTPEPHLGSTVAQFVLLFVFVVSTEHTSACALSLDGLVFG